MGRYIGRSNIEARFGTANVATWADMDNDGSEDAGRIAAAIAYAEDTIDDRLRDSIYTTPLSATGSSMLWIEDIAARLAGVWLYESRGVDDVDEFGRPQHKLSAHREQAMRDLERILRGEVRLQLAREVNGPTAPRIVF